MKKIFVVFPLLIAQLCFSQDYDLGGKLGVNYSQSIITDVISDGGIDEDDFESEPGIGVVFGGFARATFGKFIIQPELVFSQDKSYVKLQDISADDVLSADISKTDIPILIGWKVLNTIRIMAGPVFTSVKETDDDKIFEMDEITMGYQAGFGFDVSRLTFDLRYEGNLQSFTDFMEVDGTVIQFDSRKNIFQFTLGYKLFD